MTITVTHFKTGSVVTVTFEVDGATHHEAMTLSQWSKLIASPTVEEPE